MEHLTLKEQLRFYIQWCKDNDVKPSDADSINNYFREIEVIKLCLSF